MFRKRSAGHITHSNESFGTRAVFTSTLISAVLKIEANCIIQNIRLCIKDFSESSSEHEIRFYASCLFVSWCL